MTSTLEHAPGLNVDDPPIDASFNIPTAMHWLSALVDRCAWLGKMLGKLESAALAERLDKIEIERPVFIAGLARSGSTILLEALAQHHDVATHQYCDFPCLMTPVWWQQAQRGGRTVVPVERAHRDGLMVTPQSPEAMEEVLWKAWFRDAHRTDRSQLLDATTAAPKFEKFYRQHMQKLIHIRGGSRYVAKNNYNLSRLGFLLRMFPDTRIVVPVRRPRDHVASLMKQHRLFVRIEQKYPRALAFMQRAGHYEFGLDRRPIRIGNAAAVREVEALWAQGQAARGWARYWAQLYGWIANQIESDRPLADAIQVVRYEDLCDRPAEILDALRQHAVLADNEALPRFAERIHAPGYYRASFSADEERAIAQETAEVAARFGYATVASGETS